MVLANLDAEHVRDDLLGLAVELRVDEGRVVVARDAVACVVGLRVRARVRVRVRVQVKA